MLFRKIILLLMTIMVCQFSYGQTTSDINHELYQLQRKMKKGDKDALFKIAPYLDSKKELIEKLAYNHVVSTNETGVARRILEVNTLFESDEIKIDENTSSQNFLDFLNANRERIAFSDNARAFLITPLESRDVKIKFRDITKGKKKILREEYKSILGYFKNKDIGLFIDQKDPKVLLLIASELFKERDWLNSYNGNADKYIKLLQVLINCEFAVEGLYNNMTWHIEDEYSSDAALNLLCYFSANYSNFKWNSKKNIFENNNIQVISINKENELFQLLFSKNDSKALDAYIELTTCDPNKVSELAGEFGFMDDDYNYCLPQFAFRFLRQLVVFTEYCELNNIDYKGSSKLKSSISKLREEMPFSQRRKLEDNLINDLTLDEITAFEYWALIYEKSWELTYSAGRILDVFYSRNWSKLLANEKHLNCYLKKSALFDRLGIIGVCNNYLIKFSYLNKSDLLRLDNIKIRDKNICNQISKIKLINQPQINDNCGKVYSELNEANGAKNFESEVKKLINKTKKSFERDLAVSKLIAKIDYAQIPSALNIIENCDFEREMYKYSFMERDFGFFDSDFDKKKDREVFLENHSRFSEYELYAYYLDKAGIDYKTLGKLDFDKIFELIKYDPTIAFVGGGGGVEDNEVYSLIKLLEIQFNTTLGFPKKLCGPDNMYSCNTLARAKAWMNYMVVNNLLKTQHNEPVSFNFK